MNYDRITKLPKANELVEETKLINVNELRKGIKLKRQNESINKIN